MKPLRLDFAGIRSYRSPATVDFTNLDLFAVIGDTGAGKSTILEALTFGLYGRKTWSGGSIEELIADGERRLLVTFSFAADGDEWIVTRTRNRTSTPGTDKLVNRSGSVKVDGSRAITEKVTELLGLNFEQFTRAVLMPQGRFDELLRATPTDRTRILTSILGLDELKLIRDQAESMLSRWKEPVVKARTERDLLPRDPEAFLAEATAKASAERDTLQSLAKTLTTAGALSMATTNLRSATDALSLELHRLPILDRATTLDRLAELAAAGAGLLAAHAAEQETLKAIEAELETLEADEQRSRKGLASRDAVLAITAQLQTMFSVFTTANRKLEEIAAAIAEHRRSAPPEALPEALVQAQLSAAAAAEVAATAAEARFRELNEATRRWDALDTARQGRQEAAVRLAGAGEAKRAADEALAKALDREETSRDLASESDDALRAAVRDSAAAAAAAHCHPGDACPVCARELPRDFSPPTAPSVEEADAVASRARSAHQRTAQALASAQATVDQSAGLEHEAKKCDVAAVNFLGVAEKACREVALDPAAANRLVALAAAELAHTEALASSSAAEDERARRAAALREAETELRAARSGYEATLRQMTSNDQDLREDLDQCMRETEAIPGSWRPVAPLSEVSIGEAVARLQEAADELGRLEVKRAEVRESAEACRREIEALGRRGSEEVQQPAAELVTAVNRCVERLADVLGAAVVVAAILESADICAAPMVIETQVKASNLETIHIEATQALASAEQGEEASRLLFDAGTGRCNEIERQLVELLAAAGQPDLPALQSATGEVREREQSARQAVASASGFLQRAEALQKVLQVGEGFVANLETLSETLRDSGFVRHLVKARESELLAEASRRLRAISNGRFGFVADFGVANLASGEIRTPEALSGGERFQAALSLALGLVEIASRGGGRLDAVFVDEGFGSLDAKALDAALATLASVAGGGKTVALISHLRPVAEYVETVLHVTRNDVLGSRIDRLDADERDKLLADDIRSGLMA